MCLDTVGQGHKLAHHRRWRRRQQPLTQPPLEARTCKLFAKDSRLRIYVCHLPPGTSKWNKIERRFFSLIKLGLARQTLSSHEVTVQLIAATSNRKGLRVHAELESRQEPKSGLLNRH